MKVFNALLVGAILAGCFGCADEPASREHMGKITAMDRVARTLTVETASGPEDFVLDEDARVVSESDDAGLNTLAVGQEVQITARPAARDVTAWHAASVRIIDSAALVGQIEEFPAAAAADTVTIVGTDLVERTFDVETLDGPRRYHVTDATRIRSGSPSGVVSLAFEKLEPGKRVAVTAIREDNAFVATDVIVVASGPEAPDTPTED